MVSQSTDLELMLEELRTEIRGLSDRLSRLESPAKPPASDGRTVATGSMPVPEAPAAAKPAVPEPLSEELLLVLSAAVAAFLGERAHIRQVRLIRSSGWGHMGRVSIQASHQLRA